MTPKSMKKTTNFDAEDMQKKTSIPHCFSTVLGGKTGGTVPKKGGHSVFFFCFSFSVCHAMQCTTMPYNTIQYTTTPVAKNRQHSPTLQKALCPAPFLAYAILWRSPCHPAAAEGAKLSKFQLYVYLICDFVFCIPLR